MSEIPEELKFLASHEWARVEADGTAFIGISDHAQEALGDLVFVESPEVGTEVSAGDEFGVVESVKAASDILAPIDGEIVEVNEALVDEPGKVNEDPLGDAWFFKMKAADASQMDDMMDEAAYKDFIG